MREYGDVVRIAPNELVFFTPQAFRGKITAPAPSLCHLIID